MEVKVGVGGVLEMTAVLAKIKTAHPSQTFQIKMQSYIRIT